MTAFLLYSQNALFGISAGFGIGFKHLGNRLQLPRIRCGNRVFDDSGNLIESNTAFEKRRYRDLIGRVQCDRLGPACLRGFVGDTQTREFTHVWRGEVQMTQVTDREAQIRLNALRIC